MLVTLARFSEPQEAHMLRGRLHHEGLFAAVASDVHVGNNWTYSIALGGVRVQVLASEAEQAREVLKRARNGELKSELEAALGDLDDPKCPRCGSTQFWKRRPILQAVLAVVLIFLAGIFPPWNWIRTCENCGKRFRQRYGLIGKARSQPFYAIVYADAQIEDIPDIQRIRMAVRENILADPSRVQPSDVETFIRETGKGWVAKIDGAVRGFVFADPKTRNLWALFVDPDFEHCGIGGELHRRAVNWLFANGSGNLWLTTAPDTRAEKLYRSWGWKLVDAEPNGDYRFELEPLAWRHRRRKLWRQNKARH